MIDQSSRSNRPSRIDAAPEPEAWWASGVMTWCDDVGADEGVSVDVYRLLDEDEMDLGLLERIAS